MPMYEYKCTKCEKNFEELVMNEKDETSLKCPSCGSRKVARKLSAFAIKMGGGGSASLPTCPSNGATCGKSGGGFS